MNTKTFTLIILAFAASLGSLAQSTEKANKDVVTMQTRVSERSLALAKELGLDQDQTDRMVKADEQYAIAMSALRSMTTDREVLLQKGDGLAKEHEAALQDILSPEQYEKLKAIRMAKSQEGMQKLQPVQPPATQ